MNNMYKYISSNQNEKIKFLRKIRDDSKTRKESKLYMAEGITLMCEIDAELIDSYYIDEDKFDSVLKKINEASDRKLDENKIYKVKSSVFESIVDTKSSQGICVLVSMKEVLLDEFIRLCSNSKNIHLVVLENVSDPGNVGTILRSSLAFDIAGVIVDSKCADIYSPKVVRSSMGSIFRQNIYISEDLVDDIRALRRSGIKIYATSPSKDKAKPFEEINFEDDRKIGIVFGNEAHGISEDVLVQCDGSMRLDMTDKIESLNVAVCASICMYLMRYK